jgi:hypothetical protein
MSQNSREDKYLTHKIVAAFGAGILFGASAFHLRRKLMETSATLAYRYAILRSTKTYHSQKATNFNGQPVLMNANPDYASGSVNKNIFSSCDTEYGNVPDKKEEESSLSWNTEYGNVPDKKEEESSLSWNTEYGNVPDKKEEESSLSWNTEYGNVPDKIKTLPEKPKTDDDMWIIVNGGSCVGSSV